MNLIWADNKKNSVNPLLFGLFPECLYNNRFHLHVLKSANFPGYGFITFKTSHVIIGGQMTWIAKIDLQTRSAYRNTSAKRFHRCAALHRFAIPRRLTRINKTKTATKREVSAQRFRKQLLISLPLSRPVARLIMNAPRRRRAIKRQGFLILLVFVGNWAVAAYSSYRVIQKSRNRCATILICALFYGDLRSHMYFSECRRRDKLADYKSSAELSDSGIISSYVRALRRARWKRAHRETN